MVSITSGVDKNNNVKEDLGNFMYGDEIKKNSNSSINIHYNNEIM